MYVVSHTHWDREWYHTAGRFRQRLVPLVDELLDDPPAAGQSFLLDGQAVIVDDYLAVRPERRAALAARLVAGALEAGPWYVLGDELIPSGESMIRNLLAGRRVLAALGATPPAVLYSPDAFGHPAMLPALAAGFGLGVAVVWRGYGGPAWPAGDTARWSAADGSTVLLHHLSPDGYESGASLPADDASAAARWARLQAVLAPRATCGLALLPNGADHHARQPALGAALAALARAAAPVSIRAGSLGGFAAALVERARGVALPAVAGELRASYGYTWTLAGTLGARAAQKRRHALVERALLRDAEPWAALAARTSGRSHAPAVRAAWTALLRCQPHDTLCGCSLDAVARAMDARLDDVASQAAGLRADALGESVGHAGGRATSRRPVLIVRNRAARPRGGVALVDVARVLAPVRVGPGSGTRITPPAVLPTGVSLDGGRVPLQVLDRARRHDRVESPLDYPDDALVEVARAVAWVPPIPGYGAITLAVGDGAATATAPAAVRATVTTLENEWLRLRVDDGVVQLESPSTAFASRGLLALEDVGDGGDLYTHSPRPPLVRTAVLQEIELLHAGPLRAAIRGWMRLDVPLALDGDGRAPATRPLAVAVTLTLDAASPFVRVDLRGENACRDHRLRLVIRTGLRGAATYADAAFGPVRREPIVVPAVTEEAAPPTAPLHRYVTRATADRSCTIYSDGLAEYESTDDGDVAVTLVRAVGELSRNDLPERPGHAGWPCPTPEAQAPGPFEASFAILPHGPYDAAAIDHIERVADDVLLPLCGETVRAGPDIHAPSASVELEGAGLAFSACTESEDGGWTVLRCVNLITAPVAGAWRCGFAVRAARRARLDESLGEELPVADSRVVFTAAAREIVTILVR